MDPKAREPAHAADRTGPGPRWQRIGIDRVRRESDGCLVVEAAVEMPEWRASRFRPTAVFFEGERFAVRSHRTERRTLHVYELAPWADDGVERPGLEIEYDEAYVQERQRLRTAGRVADVLAVLAVPLTPLLGLLPARAQAALHGAVGVHPGTATRASITLECVCAALCAALGVIHIATGGLLTPELRHTAWLLPLLVVDAFMRYGAILKDELSAPGFLEWLVPGGRRGSHIQEPAPRD
jgi:hypothetical protein